MELEFILQEVGALHLERRLLEREIAALKGQRDAAAKRIQELESSQSLSSGEPRVDGQPTAS